MKKPDDINGKSERLLAIDPGTREIGVAIFDHGHLVYFAVKTIRDRSTAQRILKQTRALVKDLVRAYHPQTLAIEKMFIVQKSAALLSVVAAEMKTAAKECGLQIYEYYPSTIRSYLCNSGKATKRDVARVIVQKYPELERFLKSSTKAEEKYYANIFDAVAVGLRFRAEQAQQLPF